MDAREISRHIDLIDDMRIAAARRAVLSDRYCPRCDGPTDPSGNARQDSGTALEREQALTAALAAMRQVANVQ